MNAYTLYAVTQAKRYHKAALAQKRAGNPFGFSDCKSGRIRWMQAARKAAAMGDYI